MFKLVMKPEVTWPVVVHAPADGGGVEKLPAFEVRFRLMTDEERKPYDGQGYDVLLRDVVIGWNEGQIADADGKPLTFSKAALDRLLVIPYVANSMFTAWARACSATREKN